MTAAYCPKSDEGVKSAVKPGALVVGFGKAGEKVADKLRSALEGCVKASDDWEGTKVNHLVVVVECTGTGDCCEAANKFMRQVRGSDGYGVYSNIIGRKVAVLGVGKNNGKVAGAAKVEENLLKRGGCKKLVPKIGRADPEDNFATLKWVVEVREALEATMDHPPPADAKATACCEPGAASKQNVSGPPADVGSPPHKTPPKPPPPPPPKPPPIKTPLPNEDVLESEQTIGEGIVVGIVVLVAALALLRYARS